jgi:hypothetical protein
MVQHWCILRLQGRDRRRKDEIEEEEMIALACAMEASTWQQGKLPFIPGLSTKPHEMAAIKVQPEVH